MTTQPRTDTRWVQTQEANPVSPQSWRRLRQFLRSGTVRIGIAVLLVTLFLAIVGPFLAPESITKPVGASYQSAADGLPFGADYLGRDVLSRVLAGGIHLAWMAPLAAFLAVGLGALIGATAAVHGGWVDALLMRMTDVLLAFPGVIFALLFVSMLGPQRWLLVLLVMLALLPGVARVIRGAALPIVQQDYVLWARSVGVSKRNILFSDVFPNVSSPLLVEFGVRLTWAVGILASISFVGYGIQPPTADWGLMVGENRTGLGVQPWAVLIPISLVALFSVGGNLIAEGIARVIGRTEGGS